MIHIALLIMTLKDNNDYLSIYLVRSIIYVDMAVVNTTQPIVNFFSLFILNCIIVVNYANYNNQTVYRHLLT